jgi:hypothetical protein
MAANKKGAFGAPVVIDKLYNDVWLGRLGKALEFTSSWREYEWDWCVRKEASSN